MAEQKNEPGIRRADLYNINFYEKLPFYGSYKGMHYRVAGIEDDGRQLCVTTWPGPYNYETTDDGLKVSALFAYSNEGLDDAADYLNSFYQEHFS